MKIKDKRFKITALYERLSKDDEVQGESFLSLAVTVELC